MHLVSKTDVSKIIYIRVVQGVHDPSCLFFRLMIGCLIYIELIWVRKARRNPVGKVQLCCDLGQPEDYLDSSDLSKCKRDRVMQSNLFSEIASSCIQTTLHSAKRKPWLGNAWNVYIYMYIHLYMYIIICTSIYT